MAPTIGTIVIAIGVLCWLIRRKDAEVLHFPKGFVAGTFFSMLAIGIGMSATVRANVRTGQKRGR